MTIKSQNSLNKYIKKKPFIIAELSANHNGSIIKAKKLIRIAKEAGADAVKLQTFTPSLITSNSNNKFFKISKGLWKGYNLWSLYNKAQTPKKWHPELFDYAKKKKIICFSSAFDPENVIDLEKLKCPIYKVASFEMLHEPLIEAIAKTKKPIIISTGIANLDEISQSYNLAKKYKIKDITLLYCVSNYPSKSSDFNINNIEILKKKFKCKIGFSDHSIGSKISMLAVAKGAEVVEKHICLEEDTESLDNEFSLKGKEQIKEFVSDLRASNIMTSKKFFFRSIKEKNNIKFRRSVFCVKDISKGEKFNKNTIRIIRPGYGISPIFYKKILNKKSPIKIDKINPITKKILDKMYL
jgi:pseudaminic acid synthase